jgi:hypothetical protein
MQRSWHAVCWLALSYQVSREQLLDLSIARDAKGRLDKKKPFGQ